jgi:cell pole-organizing protein PopZ
MSENTQEPTMEEILASIRRIISEDDAPAEAETPAAAAAPAPEPAAAPPAAAAPAPPEPVVLLEDEEEEPLILEDEIPPEPVLEAAPIDDDLDFVAPAPMSAVAPPLDLYEPPPLPADEPLVSAPAADSVASAFGALERSVMMPPGGRSLEDVVREMLRPMLKSWLDENLPSIVQAQVAAEVERIARQRR